MKPRIKLKTTIKTDMANNNQTHTDRRKAYDERQVKMGRNKLPQVRIELNPDEVRPFTQSLKRLKREQLRQMVVNEWLSHLLVNVSPTDQLDDKDFKLIRSELELKSIKLSSKQVKEEILRYQKQFYGHSFLG